MNATVGEAPQSPSCSSSTPCRSSPLISGLPAELRLKIWTCAVEPRVIFLGDLINSPRSYPIPVVTQLCHEARDECLRGYEPVGRGSYFHFSRDILICDYKFADRCTNAAADKIAPDVERVVFWDCAPDEERIRAPDRYLDYLSICYDQEHFGRISFDKCWFPNIRDFWSVKVGDVDRRWMIPADATAPPEVRLQQSAREFRYWVHEDIIEMAPLDFHDPDTRMVLREGRCSKENCHELNRGFDLILTKVTFVDDKFKKPEDGRDWVRVAPSDKIRESSDDGAAPKANVMRWAFVERTLTYFLRCDWHGEPKENARRCRL